MGNLEIAITQYGTWDVITSSGARYRLNDHDGQLEIRAQEGTIIVFPKMSNVIQVAAMNWDGTV